MKSLKFIVPGLFLALCLTAYANGDRKAFKEAKAVCAKEVGAADPVKGSRRSKEDRKKIKTCLKEKGITRPEKRRDSEKTKVNS